MTCTERVRALVNRHPPARAPTLAEVARALAVSPRTLRRRLAEEGTSYRQLTQAQRSAAARALLEDPELHVKGIAAELGFSDLTAFHRAFRRWCRRTPGEYRAAALGSPAEPRSGQGAPGAALPGAEAALCQSWVCPSSGMPR